MRISYRFGRVENGRSPGRPIYKKNGGSAERLAAMKRPVAIDARMIAHSGIGTHIAGLLQGWREAVPDFRPILLGDPDLLAERLPDVGNYQVVPYKAPIYGLREQVGYPARRLRGVLLHCPHYNIALRHRGPLVVTIHDLIHLDKRWGVRSPLGKLYAATMMRLAVRRSHHILAVSEATARALIERFDGARGKVSVIHNAPGREFSDLHHAREQIGQLRRNLGLPEQYLLTVGLYKPHKNLDLLLQTLKALWRQSKIALPFVMAGTQASERPALIRRLRQLGATDRVRVLDRLPREQMPLLYAGATALILPSLLEGFGLPVVEAQAVGTPVVAARASALPEIAGEGALFFDPYSSDDLARAIAAVVADPRLRERLITAGRRNVERFSWPKSAEKVLAVYESIP